MPNTPDPRKMRNLGVTLVVLVVVGIATGLVFERLDRCTHWPQTMSARC